MLIQTIQPQSMLSVIKKEGIVYARANFEQYEKSTREWGFQNAYDWMKEQMINKGLPPEGNSQDLFWAWAWSGDLGKKVIDLRTRKSHNLKGQMVLTLEKDDILLSDFEFWHYVINYWPIALSSKEEKYWNQLSEIKNNFYENKPLENKKLDDKIRQTWQNIFNIKEEKDYFTYDLSKSIKKYLESDKLVTQATFWSIKESDIVSVKLIN